MATPEKGDRLTALQGEEDRESGVRKEDVCLLKTKFRTKTRKKMFGILPVAQSHNKQTTPKQKIKTVSALMK